MPKRWLSLFILLFLMPVPAGASLLLGQPQAVDERHCLALNIYFEARSEPLLGKIAVGHVVLNRMRDRRFPGSVCAVVKQGGDRIRHRCQFSWWCDGRSDRPANRDAWSESLHIASLIYTGALPDPTGGALWYHADYVKPRWSSAFSKRAKLGRHIFYLDAGDSADPPRPHEAAKCLAVTRRPPTETIS